MGKASRTCRTWGNARGGHTWDTIHVLPKVAHEHGDCRRRADFWAGLGWMFADLD